MGVGRMIGGKSGGASAEIPEYTYSGDHLVRFQDYNGILYAEWELRTSGILTFTEAQLLDLMLIGGGGRCGAATTANSNYTGPGGSAYYTVVKAIENALILTVTIGSGGGDTTITIAGVTYTGQRGGNGSGTSRGAGHIGEYRLFDEPGDKYVLGITTGGTNANGASSAGIPGSGCTLSLQVSGGIIRNDGSSGGPPTPGAVGYGAGEGSARGTQIYPIVYFGARGNPGVALVRVPLT